MSTDAAGRLARLVSLVPWLLEHQGASAAETAARFQITEEELDDDLSLLFLSGRPGHMPDDLIDVIREDGRIYLDNAAELAVPVRLTGDEAAALLVALRALSDSGLAADHLEALDSASEKLQRATGVPRTGLDLQLPAADGEVHASLSRAIAAGRAVEIDYLVASRDELTTRVISPRSLLTAEGRWYVDAWCHTAAGERRFRLDAVHALREPAEVPEAPRAGRPSSSMLPGLRRGAPVARLRLAADRATVAERIPARRRDYAPDGTVEVEVALAEPDWLHRLLLEHGDAVLSIDPPELAAEALSRARAALTRGAEGRV